MWTEPTKKAEKTGGFLFYFVAKQFYLCEESAPLLFLAGKTAMNGIVGAFFATMPHSKFHLMIQKYGKLYKWVCVLHPL